jgi:FAD/FMN-containing dehydrogenase
MEEHPFVSINEAKAMFGPADGPGANLTNWGQNYCGHNLHVHHPKTYEEVAGLVKALAAQGAKVRVLAVMHSWSNVFADDGTHVIFLDNFKTIAQAPNDYTLVTLQVRRGLVFTLLPCPPSSGFFLQFLF